MEPVADDDTATAYSDLRGIDCILAASPAIPTADLRVYLEHAGARVDAAASADEAARCVDAFGDRPVVLLQEANPHGTVRGALGADPLRRTVTLAEGGLRRDRLLRAVADAAGRKAATVDRPPELLSSGVKAGTAPTIAAARLEGRLVLVAEDDPVNQKVDPQATRACSATRPRWRADGVEALRLWREGTAWPGPYRSAHARARRLRPGALDPPVAEADREGQTSRIPIVALTASALRDEAARVRDAGMDEYLTKPIQLATLGKALGALVAGEHGRGADRGSFSRVPRRTGASAGQGGRRRDPEEPGRRRRLATVREFLSDFLAAARDQSAEIVASCAAEDNLRVGSVAHKLKGIVALGRCARTRRPVRRAGERQPGRQPDRDRRATPALRSRDAGGRRLHRRPAGGQRRLTIGPYRRSARRRDRRPARPITPSGARPRPLNR